MIELIQPYIPHLTIFSALIAVLFVAHRSSENQFTVFDYFMDPATGKASITKTLQMVGGLTATWIVVKMAANNTLTPEMFLIYTGVLGVSEAWSKFVGAKYLAATEKKEEAE